MTAANSRSPAVGGERIATGAFLRHLVTSGDILSGEYGQTDGLEDATISYVTPFVSPRTTLSIRGSLNNAAIVDRPLVPLDISSRDRAAEIGLTQRILAAPLLPNGSGDWIPARSLSAGVLFAYRESKSFLLGEPFSFSPGSVNGRSEYYALRLIGDYVQRSVDQVIALSLTGTMGLDGTRSDLVGVPSPSRNFLAVLAQANYARRLTEQGLELRARLTGQYSGGTLYSGERISAGGEGTVRGYRENLLLADRGVVGSVELSHPLRLGGERRGTSSLDWGLFSVGAFADAAYLRNARPPQPAPAFIPSVGGSIAWTPSEAIEARLSYGHALRDIEQTGSRDLQDRGFHFRVSVFPLKLFRR
jgi:hemolysin activation/secretion protein